PLGPLTLFQIPTLGFSTWNLKENATEAVSYAISTRYRYIDAIAIYGNEPIASTKKGNEISFLDTWKAMVQLVQSGKTRRIGVSNFSPNQLDTLLNHTTHVPFAHQMELHPYLPQNDWIQYHKVRNIRVTAYSPLRRTNPTYH
ncbi:hypothetical protein D6D10_06140, partial [Aureobasidium pullulans]